MYCCVPFCRSDRKKSRGILSFHEFPVDQNQSEQWLKVIARDNFVPNCNSSSSVVCSLHFKDDDYQQLLDSRLRRLKKGTVPSLFPKYPSYNVIRKMNPRRKIPKIPPPSPRKCKKVQAAYDFQCPDASCSTSKNEDANAAKRKAEKVTVMCDPNYSQESLRMGEESEEHEAIPQVCIKQEVVVKEEVQDPLEYLDEFQEEQPSWSENNFSSRENLMEGDSNALYEPVPQVWVKEEIEVKEEVPDPLEISEETSEEQPSCSEFR